MNLADELREIRQECFLSQNAFAEKLGVSFSTINRWETGKAIPNCIKMKRIVEFCEKHNINYENVNKAWKETRNGVYTH